MLQSRDGAMEIYVQYVLAVLPRTTYNETKQPFFSSPSLYPFLLIQKRISVWFRSCLA